MLRKVKLRMRQFRYHRVTNMILPLAISIWTIMLTAKSIS